MSSSRLSDSVEIRSLPAARGLHWLDAVHPPTVPAPAAAAAFAANDNSSSELTPNAARASSPKPEQQTTPAGKQRTQQELCGASPIAVEDEAATDISDGTPPTAAALTLKFQRIAAAAKERTPEAAKPPRPTSLATRVSRQVAKGGYASRLEASKNSSTRTTGAGVQDYRDALVSAVLDSPAPATTTTTNPSKCVEERSPETEDGCDDDMESECRQEIPQPVARSPFHDSSRHVAQHSSFSSAIVQALSQSEGAAILSMSQASYLSHLPAKDSDARDGMPVDAQSRRALALYDDAIRSKMAKEHWASLERARQELLEEARLARDCPFQPQVSAYAAKIKRPAELRPENRAKAELLRRTQWIAMRQQEEVLKELESCTFRPLTLRAVELNPEALQINPDIFAELYHEAQEKHHFETVIRPQVVEQLERRRAHGDFALPMEKVQEVVDRLFTRAVTISAANAEELARVHANQGKPELSAETQRIIERQIHKGERDSDVVSNLYQVRRGPSLDALLDERIRLGEERMAQALRAQESEKERQRLERQRIRTVLAAKFRALARRVCTARRQVFRPGMSYSIVDIAKAALDVLLPKEAEELLGAVEHCGMEKLNEASFIVLILRYAQDRYAEHNQQCAILLEPPPANTIASQKRMERSGGDASASYTGQQSTSSFRRIKREKADPELLERAKAKREERKEQWRQEALRRERGEMEDEEAVELTFKPAPRRLIPYECRPDVVVEVKTTKADALRRAHIREKQRALHEAPDPLAVPDFVATLGVPLSETRGPSSTRQPPTSRVLFSHDRNSSNPAPDKSHRRYSSPDSAAMAEEDDGPRGDADGRRRGATHSAAATSLSSPHRSSYGRQRSSPPPELNDEAARRRARGSGTIMPSSMSRDAPTQPNAAARSPPSASHLTRARGERLYRDVISEHGAFGGEEALAHLGRELLMRQLRDFQEQRAGSRSP